MEIELQIMTNDVVQKSKKRRLMPCERREDRGCGSCAKPCRSNREKYVVDGEDLRKYSSEGFQTDISNPFNKNVDELFVCAACGKDWERLLVPNQA